MIAYGRVYIYGFSQFKIYFKHVSLKLQHKSPKFSKSSVKYNTEVIFTASVFSLSALLQ